MTTQAELLDTLQQLYREIEAAKLRLQHEAMIDDFNDVLFTRRAAAAIHSLELELIWTDPATGEEVSSSMTLTGDTLRYTEQPRV